MERDGALSRGSATWLLYGAFGCMAFLLNGLGAVLNPLQKDLHVSRGVVGIYPSVFAAGLILVGVAGARLVSWIGREAALRLALAGMILGGLFLAAPAPAVTLVGTLSVGLGAALLIQLVPAGLSALHPRAPAGAIGEANGLASAASILAPLSVAAALAAGIGWRPGYLVPPLVGLAGITFLARRLRIPGATSSTREIHAVASAPMLGRWVDLLVAVSIEFCIVFWAASAVIAWDHASATQAPTLASLFLLGMATARISSVQIIRRIPNQRALILACTGGATAGFALFWAAPTLGFAALGLFLSGLGIALLYPTALSRVVAAWPQAPDRAAARAALASGLAIGGAPFLLAQLSDLLGLRRAFLIVPGLLLLLAIRGGKPERTNPRPLGT